MSLKSLLILNQKTDTVDTPEPGKIHFYLSGTTLNYKDSNGVVYTLATGVSLEDVQDIVGSFIQPGSNKLSVVYNDPGNILVLDVDETKINHLNILNKGVNTHAQIDSRLSSLTNVDNTSDANKPVSTAQQTALNLKYNASNPLGFETPAQLDVRDTNNRNRTNHSGTQLASTISNFAATVLSSVITGVTFATNSAILATDTVLIAFGKLQAQVSFVLSVLATQIIGDNFQDFLDDTPFSTSATTNQVAGTFTTTTKAVGRYRIGLKFNFTTTSTSLSPSFGLYVDGVLVDSEIQVELKDTTDDIVYYTFVYLNFATVTTHTIELRTRVEGAMTVTINRIRAEIWRANV